MAVRLPLVLSQPGRRDAVASELIEDIVAAALLVPRLDANLVGDLSEIDTGSTDHLCLQGHTRDLILASFMDLDAVRAAWLRLGQTGLLIDCQQSHLDIRALAAQTPDRRVYYFQLKHDTNVPRLLDQCQELVAAQAVQLVSIGLGPNGTGSISSATTVTKSLPVIAVPSKQVRPPGASSPAMPVVRDSAVAHPVSEEDCDWSAIDKLVDDLDALDI